MFFIDTSVSVGYIADKDSNYEKAVSLMEEITKGKLSPAITPECLLDETVTIVLLRLKSLESAIMPGELIKKLYRRSMLAIAYSKPHRADSKELINMTLIEF